MNNKRPVSEQSRAFNQRLGAEIRRVRISMGRTQSDVAAAIGYASPATIHYMEDGVKMIPASDLVAMANYFGVTIRSMFPRGSVR